MMMQPGVAAVGMAPMGGGIKPGKPGKPGKMGGMQGGMGGYPQQQMGGYPQQQQMGGYPQQQQMGGGYPQQQVCVVLFSCRAGALGPANLAGLPAPWFRWRWMLSYSWVIGRTPLAGGRAAECAGCQEERIHG